MRRLLILIVTLVTTSAFAQVNPTNLTFYDMEVIDTLSKFNEKSNEDNIKQINDKTFILNQYKNIDGCFLLRKIKDKYIISDIGIYNNISFDEIRIIKNFVIVEYFQGGSARQSTWTNSTYVIINTLNSKMIDFWKKAEYEGWNIPDQKPNESEDDYFKRVDKETKVYGSSCESKIKFDGLYLRVARTYKNGCKDCVETGTYKLVKDIFYKLK